MPSEKLFRPLTHARGLTIASTSFAQSAASAAASAAGSSGPSAASTAPATTAQAATSAASGTGRGRGSRGTGAAAPAPPPPLVDWVRPAEGPAVFKEDFEMGKLDDRIWTVHATGNATAKVQQEMAAHGKSALMVTYPAGTARDYAFVSMKVPEALKDHFYGRAYVYISGVPDPHSVLLFGGSTGFPTANWLEIGTYYNMFQPSLQIQAPTADLAKGETAPHQGALPVGRWFCLEFELNDKPDRIVIWVDGKLTTNLPFTYGKVLNPNIPKDSGLVGGFVEFDLGYRTFAPATAISKDINIYYDDIALGDKPIGQLTPVVAKPAAASGSATK